MMLAIFSTLGIAAHAAQDPLKDFTFSGHLDLYYQYDFGKPATGYSYPDVTKGVNLRQFDVGHNSFSLAVTEFDIVKKATADNPFGLTLNLIAGKNADIINAGEPGGDGYKYFQQAYVTYAAPKGVTVDFGKFLTWIGYEGVDSSAQDNYSRSFLFYFCQPVYHTGLRASVPLGSSATASAFFVNGWNETEDSNASKSAGASLSGTFGKTTVTANYYGGNEGSPASGGIYNVNGFFSNGVTNVQLGDLVVVHQLTSKIKLALNGDYASAKASDLAADPTAANGHFSGLAGYVAAQFNDKFSGAIRYEGVSDPDGARGGLDAHYNSLTGTLNFQASPTALFRLELRYDKCNRDVFNSDNGANDNRTTLTLSHVLKF